MVYLYQLRRYKLVHFRQWYRYSKNEKPQGTHPCGYLFIIVSPII